MPLFYGVADERVVEAYQFTRESASAVRMWCHGVPLEPLNGKQRMIVYLVQVKVAKRLADAGISLQKMRKAVSALRSMAPDIEKPLAQFEFISDGWEIYVADSEERMIAITRNMGQFYWRWATWSGNWLTR